MTLRRPRSIVNIFSKQYKQRQRKHQRQFSRKLLTEKLEDRRLLAGPELMAIRPDEAALLQVGDTLNTAPREFNLLFKGGADINPATIANNIRLIRAGNDGIFDDPATLPIESTDDIRVDLGFLGLEDPLNPLQIVLRPASLAQHNVVRPRASLPDDLYRIDILPGLQDTSGNPFNGGVAFRQEFRLDLGAQVVAVVPQPVSRNTQRIQLVSGASSGSFILNFGGASTAPIALPASSADIRTALEALPGNRVRPDDLLVTGGGLGPWDVTFQGHFAGEQVALMTVNPSGLNMGGATVTRLSGLTQARNQVVVYLDNQDLDPAQAIDPKFYRMINTNATLTTVDDSVLLPQRVTYDTVDNSLVLTFANDLPEGTYRLDIGFSNENNNTLQTAVNVGSLFNTTNFSAVSYLGDDVVSSTTDVDMYALRLAGGSMLTVDVTPHAALLDIAVRLLDVNGAVVAGPINGNPAGGAEQLLFNVPAGPANQAFFVEVDSPDGSTGSYRLTTTVAGAPIDPSDVNTSISTATPLGVLGLAGVRHSAQIEPQTIALPPYPGGNDEPGHREIQLIPPNTMHTGAVGTTARLPNNLPVTTYWFPATIGTDTSGNPYPNLITEEEKNNVRSIFEIFADVSGYEFRESTAGGMMIGKGDLRALDPGLGPDSGVAGLGGSGGVVANGSLFNQANREYGDGFTGLMFHEIGHAIGLGHSYDVPSILGSGVPNDVLPGDHDVVHLQRIATPNSTDIDLYQFQITEMGRFNAETIAERRDQFGQPSSLLDTVLTLYRQTGTDVELVARNDNYYGNDSFLDVVLEPGTYYVGVTSTGNTQYDPRVPNSGFGGKTDGAYDLQLNFTANRDGFLRDARGTAIDGNGDGTPGGIAQFWFETSQHTIFVDKANDFVANVVEGDGSLGNPFDTVNFALQQAGSRVIVPQNGVTTILNGQRFLIDDGMNPPVTFEFRTAGMAAFPLRTVDISAAVTPEDIATAIENAINAAIGASLLDTTVLVSGRVVQLSDISELDVSLTPALLNATNVVRIVGNGGLDQNLGTLGDNRPYLIGTDIDGNPLADGAEFLVPQGTTVMVQGGALFKMRKANLDVGTSSANISRAQGALQLLGTPHNSVLLRSYHNDAIGGDSDGIGPLPRSGDFGGVVFRGDSDLEHAGIFLNYVNHVNINNAGGRVFVDSVEQVFSPVHMIDARPTVSFNTITNSDDAAMSATPNSFDDVLGRIGPDIQGNYLSGNTINGLFIRVQTSPGQPVERLTVNGRFDDVDITHVLTENLQIEGNPGGPLVVGGNVTSRPGGRLMVDPGIILKIGNARIEAERGSSSLIAEGTVNRPVIFTSINDDRFGGSGSFDVNGNGNVTPQPGDWSGLVFNHTSSGSIDHALISFAGGGSPIAGTSTNFNTIEVHQASLRLTNSVVTNNANGNAAGTRNGRGNNQPATIYVRGAQPIIVNNIFQDNLGPVININANSLRFENFRDYGRSTGTSQAFSQLVDNHGPLIRLNRLANNTTNGMLIRGEELTTESIWDDADIVHVLQSEIRVDNHHTYSGLRLQSSNSESLVVKLSGPNAGFTATGTPLDIIDRIGGTVQIVGTVGHPVIMTDLADDTVGAGFTPRGAALLDTNNDGPSVGAPGAWRGLVFNEFSNDRNVAIVRELESPLTNKVDVNRTIGTAQLLGTLAPNQKSGDENRRLGFEVHGFISLDDPTDVDIYSFSGTAGTEVWFDIDRTDPALHLVLEVVNGAGTVVARAHTDDTGGLILSGTTAASLEKEPFRGGDFYSQNFRDPGMRFTLPGTAGVVGTYFVRVRSRPVAPNPITVLNQGGSRGAYQLQVRLQQVDEFPGSTVRFADIRYAQTGIDVRGLPAHSPLIGEASEMEPNNTSGTANILVNLLQTDVAALSIAGNLATDLDVDFYQFTINQTDIQGFPPGGTVSVVFDIDYADGAVRPDTTIAVFDQTGRLIFTGRESNVIDDQPAPGQAPDIDDLSRASLGLKDPFIGPIHLPAHPARTYFVAVMSDRQIPTSLTASFVASPVNAASRLARLEPINSLVRVVEDHIGFRGYRTGPSQQVDPATPGIFDISSSMALATNVRPFSLQDVVLYVATDNAGDGGGDNLYTVDSFVGGQYLTRVTDNIFGGVNDVQDIVMRSDGRFFGYQRLNAVTNSVGGLVEINPNTGAATLVGNDNILGRTPTPNVRNTTQLAANIPNRQEQFTTSDEVDALTFERRTTTGPASAPVPVYELYYVVRETNHNNLGAGLPANSKLYRARPNGSATAALASGGNPSYGLMGDIQPANVDYASVDFSVSDNAAPANNTSIRILSKLPGTAGNAIVLNITTTGANTAATVTAGGTTINLVIGRTGGPPPTAGPSAQAIVDAINNNETARNLVTAVIVGGNSDNATSLNHFPIGSLNLSGGADGVFLAPLSGRVTGLSFGNFNSTGNLFGVTSAGEFLEISKNTGQVLKRYDVAAALGGGAISFQGLSLGPQNVEAGNYATTLFAVTTNGTLYAFDAVAFAGLANLDYTTEQVGVLRTIFDSDNDGVADSQSVQVTSMANTAIGVAFSPLDFNLWHPTMQRGNDAGHGINPAPDLSRTPGAMNITIDNPGPGANRNTSEGQGGASFRFGFEQWNQTHNSGSLTYLTYEAGVNAQLGVRTTNIHQDLSTNPVIANGGIGSYNFPGGALGSLQSTGFSLAGYSHLDRPTLYFNYFLGTENHPGSNVSGDGNNPFRDSARVFASRNGGATWELLATNNSQLSAADPTNAPGTAELPGFLSHLSDAGLNSETPRVQSRQIVQELFDNTGVWRQARVDLSTFAGVADIQLRFDFSTAGSMNDPTLTRIDSDWTATGNAPFGEFQSNTRSIRSLNNQFEGFYVDDIIVGFAERGEMVTSAPNDDTRITNLFGTARTTDNDPAQYPDINSGLYQLEIRRAGEFAGLLDDGSISINSRFDTNDQHVDASDPALTTTIDFEGIANVYTETPLTLNFQALEDQVNAQTAGITPGQCALLPLLFGVTVTTTDPCVLATSSYMTPWVVSTNAQTGAQSMQSGMMGDAGTSIGPVTTPFSVSAASLRLTDIAGPNPSAGAIRFAVSVSSEKGLDGFRFFIDGVAQNVPQEVEEGGSTVTDTTFVSGEVPYQVLQFPFGRGDRVFSWVYFKDNSGTNAGADRAFVDNIVVLQGGTGLLGDSNRERAQGMFIIESNFISDAETVGINVQPGTTQAGGNMPHPGSTINFPQLNQERLVPGVVIQNNVIAASETGIGIRFAGENTTDPQRPVPFGRIVNNTIFGGTPTVGGGTADVDIVFIMDNSGSMGPAINNVKQNLLQLETAAQAANINARYGAVRYPQGPISTDPVQIQDFTDFATFSAVGGRFDTIPILGAIERASDAILEALNEFDPASGPTTFNYTPGSRPVIILVTDEPDNSRNSQPAALSALINNNALFYCICSTTGFFGGTSVADYGPFATATGGALFSIASFLANPVVFFDSFTQTLVGAVGGGGTATAGIVVENNASPTLMNNVVAGFQDGIIIGAGSGSTVINSTAFRDNTNNVVGAGLGFSPLLLQPTDPLFVNPGRGNFLPADGSPIVDSSLNLLQDRFNYGNFKDELGIPLSNINAPDRDALGQLRVDSEEDPLGAGSSVFKDRGAIDKADTTQPYAQLLIPLDNDAAGADLDPNSTVVHRTDVFLKEFSILLGDGAGPNSPFQGTGINERTVDIPLEVSDPLDPDATISQRAVRLTRNGQPLVEDRDYTLGYNANSDVLLLTPLSSLWEPNSVYVITLNNTLIQDNAQNFLRNNQPDGSTTFTIILGEFEFDYGDAPNSYGTLLANNGARHVLLPEAPLFLGARVDADSNGQPSVNADGDDRDQRVDLGTSVLTRVATAPYSIQIPAAGGAALVDDQTFTINDGTNPPVTFRLDLNNNGVASGVPIAYYAPDPQALVTDRIVQAIQNQVLSGNLVGVTARNLGGGTLHITGGPGLVVNAAGLTNFTVADRLPTTLQVPGAGVLDQQTFTIRDGNNRVVTFEFEETTAVGLTNTNHVAVNFTTGQTASVIATAIETAVQSAITSGRLAGISVLAAGDMVSLTTTSGVQEDDEDGVTIGKIFVPAQAAPNYLIPLQVVASADGMLDAWIDFNGNGVFNPEEKLFGGSILVTAGVNLLTINPADYTNNVAFTPGQTYARFRISAAGGLFPTGLGVGGEVEDYHLRILSNTAPSIANPVANFVVLEDTADTVIDLTPGMGVFNDVDIANGNGDFLTYRFADNTTSTTFLDTTTNLGLITATINAQGNLVLDYVADRNGQTVVSVKARDHAGLEQLHTFTVTVTAVNDAPVVTVPGAQVFNEGGLSTAPLASYPITGISVVDVDAAEIGGGPIVVTLTIPNGTGTLSVNPGVVGGLAPGNIVGNGSAMVTLTGTVAQINATLANATGVTYTVPSNDFNNTNGGDVILNVTANDQGNTGAGGPQTDSENIAITITPINDAPIVTVPGPQMLDEGDDASAILNALVIAGISVADVDVAETVGGTLIVTLSIPVGTGTLLVNAGVAGGVPAGNIGTNGTRMITLTGTPVQINATLADAVGVTYTVPTDDFNNLNNGGPVILSVQANDQGNSGAGGILTTTRTVAITVNPINDAPVVTVPGAQALDEGGLASDPLAALAIAGISVVDVDAAEPTGGPIVVTLSIPAGSGSLTVNSNVVGGVPLANIANNSSSLVTLTGTVAQINNTLANSVGVTYRVPDNDFNRLRHGGPVNLTVTANDQGHTGAGGVLTHSQNIAITVNAINDAPIVTVPDPHVMNEGGLPSDPLAALAIAGISVVDVDADEFGGGPIVVTVSIPAGTGTLRVNDSVFGGAAMIVGNFSNQVTLTGTVAQINTTLLDATGVTYTVPDNDFNNLRNGGNDVILTVQASDQGNTGAGGTLNDSETVAISIVPINDAPIVTVPASQMMNEGGLASDPLSALAIAGISVVDVDAFETGGGPIVVTLSIPIGTGSLTVNGSVAGGVPAGSITGNVTRIVTLTGTVTQINNTLMAATGVTYTVPSNDFNNLRHGGDVTLTVSANDQGNTGAIAGVALTDSETIAITVAPINDAPIVTVPGPQMLNEGDDASATLNTLAIAGISVVDVDAFETGGGPIVVTLSIPVGSGTLAVNGSVVGGVPAGNIGTNGTRQVTLTGTVAQINATLAHAVGVTYRVPDDDFNNLRHGGDVILTVAANDQGNTGVGGALSDSETIAITVNPVNDAPVVTVPGLQVMAEGGLASDPLAALAILGISVVDVDASETGGGPIVVTLSIPVGMGSLLVNPLVTGGVAAGNITGNTTRIVTLTGTVAAINATLLDAVGVTYVVPDNNFNSLRNGGNVILTVNANDQGNTGVGGIRTDTETVAITVSPINDPPVVTVPGPQNLDEGDDATGTLNSLAIAGVSVVDADASETGGGPITLNLSIPAGTGTLRVQNNVVGGVTAANISGNGTRIVTLTGTVIQINNTLLHATGVTYMVPSVNFDNLHNGGDVILTITANDQGNTGAVAGVSLTDTETIAITVNPINDPPIAVNDNYSTDEDTLLSVAARGVLTNDIDVDFGEQALLVVVTADVMSVRGAPVAVQADGSFTFDPRGLAIFETLPGGQSLTDTFTYTIADPQLAVSTATVTVTVQGRNDAPILHNNGNATPDMTLPTITEDQIATQGISVAALLATTSANGGDAITDIDTGSLEGIALVGSTGNGTWQYSIDGGTNFVSVGVVSSTQARLLRSQDVLRYLPDQMNGEAGVNAPSITFRAWDRTSGTAGQNMVDTSSNGGITAFSTALETATITVTSINDAPVLDNSGAMTLTPITEDELSNAGTSIADIIASSTVPSGNAITDVDANSVEGIAIISLSGRNANGWQFRLSGDPNFQPVGPVSNTSARLLPATATLRYIPDGLNGETASVTFRAWDTTSGAAGGLGNSSVNGGTTSFSTTTEVATLVVLDRNDAPVANHDAYTVTEDVQLTVSGQGVLLNDTDVDLPPQTLTIATVNGAALGGNPSISTITSLNATLTVNSVGSFTYDPTLSATLQSLAVGQSQQDFFQYTVRDNGINPNNLTSNVATVTITVTGVNDRPVASNVNVAATEDGPPVDGSFSAFDIDSGETATLRYSIVTPPNEGTVTTSGLPGDAAFTFNPGSAFQDLGVGETRQVTFTYRARDVQNAPNSDSNLATVTVTVTGVNDPPIAGNVSVSTSEDGPVINDLLAVTDVDDTDLIYSIVSGVGVGNGTVSIGAAGTFTFDPGNDFQSLAANEFRAVTFTYRAQDLTAGGAVKSSSNVATVTVTVAGLNDPPVAVDDANVTDEDTILTVPSTSILSLLNNDIEIDFNDTIQVVGFDTVSALGALVTVDLNGGYTYNPTNSATLQALTPSTGPVVDTFRYTIRDTQGATSTATVSITVAGVNDAPVARPDFAVTSEDVAIAITAPGVLANDFDPDAGETATLRVMAGNFVSTLGAAVVITGNGLGGYSYDPTQAPALQALRQGTSTVDTFVYTVRDNNGNSSLGTVSVTVQGANDAPVANDDSASIDEDSVLTVAGSVGLFANDFDPDANDPINLKSFQAVSNLGAAVVVSADGGFTYDPRFAATLQALSEGQSAVDRFTYEVVDSLGATDSATVTITVLGVNDPPVAVNDAAATDEDTPLSIPVSSGLLANDTDAEGNTLSVSSVNGLAGNVGSTFVLPSGATLFVSSGGAIDYDPSTSASLNQLPVGATFIDTFVYQAFDGTSPSATPGTMAITITGVNDRPTAVADSFATSEDALLLIAAPGILLNDFDVDGDTLRVIASSGASSRGASVIVNVDGSFSYDPRTSAQLQALAAGQSINDSFIYTISDGNGGTASSIVTITVNGVNDAPVAVGDSYRVDEDSILVVSGAGVLENDFDPDTTDSISVGTFDVSSSRGASVSVNPNGTFTYDPTTVAALQQLAPGQTAIDTFTYRVSDGTTLSNTATVTITVDGVNDAPTVVNDTYSVDEDRQLTVSAAEGVLANDSDPEGSPLSASLVTGPTHGRVVLNSSGFFTYTPDPNFNGSDSFTYSASDGSLSSLGTVTINVRAVNDAPIAFADAYTVPEGGSLSVSAANGVLANDVDVDLEPLRAVYVNGSGPANGSLTLNINGSLTYTPNAEFFGTDSFRYFAQDGGGLSSSPVTVTIDVVNTRPRRNPLNPLDVNGDGLVSAIDALLIINEINKNGAHEIPSTTAAIAPFWDVNGDGFVSSIDVLRVVNALNGDVSSEGEGTEPGVSEQGLASDLETSEITVLSHVDQSFWIRQVEAERRPASRLVTGTRSVERFSTPIDAAFAAVGELNSEPRRSEAQVAGPDLGDLVDQLADAQASSGSWDEFEAALGELFGRE